MISTYRRLLQYLLLPIFLLAQAAGAQGHLIISQLYGGGGNTGSVYSNDFVELYNPTSAAIDLSTYSLQYAAVTGTFSSSNTLVLSGSVQAGHYFLIKLAPGTNTPASLPTPDFEPSSHVLNLSGTGGKLALVPSTATLASGCPAVTAYTDFVGWGAANGNSANCSYNDSTGANRAAATANGTGLSLNSSNSWTGVNSADYTVGTPNPRNSSYSTVSVATLAIASSSATPATITAGDITVLSVTVTPGTATTSVTAMVDLSTVGGSAAQPMALSATANTYTYAFASSTGLAADAYLLPVTAVDNTNAMVNQSIALKVVAPVVTTPISTIQANRSTYLGNTITFNGVITTVVNAGYYLQTASATPGSTGDEGIYVYNGNGKNPAGAVVGNNVTVTGTLTQFPLPAVSHTPSLEVTGSSLTVNSTGNPLPAAIAITAPTATGDINQLRQYESMLVSLSSVTAVGGTDASLVETTETTTSSGQFYVIGTGMPRSFREPGMDFRDFPTATCPTLANCPAATNPATAAGVARPANLTLYDDNPERLIMESSLAGGKAIDVTAGAVLTGVQGVVDYSYSTDSPFGDPARIILGTMVRPVVTPSPLTVTALPLPAAGQFTVAAFNVERFFNATASDNFYYDPATQTSKPILPGNSVVVTADAYARRLKKFSLAVRTVLNNPDIISVEEVENLQVLKDMAAQIDADTTTGTKPGYVAYGTDSTMTFTNDVGGISIGFLVKPSTVNVAAWEQMGTQDMVPGGAALNDRPSQVLHATINRGAGAKPYPITVISNHLRSLDKIGTDSNVRLKKELQAEMLANLIQGYQQAGEHVIAVGDMNAFEFSDGYTDTLGTITGRVGNGVAVMPGKAIVSPVATDLMTTLPDGQRQSYTEWGNAQVLDHAVVTADIAGSSTISVGHMDADYPLSLYNDATTPARLSDHDPILAYLALPAPLTSATLTGNGTFATGVDVGMSSTGQQLTLTNAGETVISITGFTVTGDFSQSNNCGLSLAVGASCAVNVVFQPTTTGTRTGSITLVGSATVAPVTLTGTGLLPSDFSLADSSNNTTTSLTLSAGTSGTVSLKLTSTNGFAGSVAFVCAAQGTAATGVICTVTSPVTLAAAGTATAMVTLNTTARTMASTSGLGALPGTGMGRVMCLLLAGMVAGVVLMAGRNGRAARIGGLLMLLFALTLGVTGCGDSKHLNLSPNPNGTPNGTYAYVVTATSGSASHQETIKLTVN